jgi:hypothetical protein
MNWARKRALRVTFVIFFITPLLAWFLVKPARIVAPELMGLKCFDEGLCLDSEANYINAKKLRDDAIEFVSEEIAIFHSAPKIIFCSTWECAEGFGLGKRSVVTFGSYGIAISPRAWKAYYIRHELIHLLQAQELGTIKCLLLPSWLIEGMAYSLSQDPRPELEQPWEEYRRQFNRWIASIDKTHMWSKAGKIW